MITFMLLMKADARLEHILITSFYLVCTLTSLELVSLLSSKSNSHFTYYETILALSRDPKFCTCRLGITRTKNKSKTPGYRPRPINYYRTELLTTGKPNIF